VTDAEEVRRRVAGLMGRAREDLARLVAMPSVHGGSPDQLAACRAAGAEVLRLVREAGVANAELVETDDGSAAVIGHVAGPEGAPTVLLYSHYDVQPPGDPAGWSGSPWELVERDGRWFGRGAADCKGNLVMLLTALRAVERPWPVGIRIVCEGSEEASTGGLTRLATARPELFGADLMLIADSGNVALGQPTATTSLRGTGSVQVTVSTLEGPVHSGMFGGAAPDALAALVAMLATLRDEEGRTTVRGLDGAGRWEGAAWDPEVFREDAGILTGVDVIGGAPVADAVWARPVANILAIDAPRIAEATAAIQPTASALVNLRVPPGQSAKAAQELLIAHLRDVAPWHVRVEVTPRTLGEPFATRTDGPGFAALGRAMEVAFGRPLVTTGQGGAIPLCNTLQATHPDAEILLLGVEEPACRIHSPGESVDPAELERTAFGLALTLLALGE
jgi:acetylornithine deacetylase/succinyl-diaminopimelate desuccinylase-like protein